MPDWWFGMFSTRTVVYGSGRIALEGMVDPAELKFCRSFAEKAGGDRATWHRFFVVADVDAPAPERNEEVRNQQTLRDLAGRRQDGEPNMITRFRNEDDG